MYSVLGGWFWGMTGFFSYVSVLCIFVYVHMCMHLCVHGVWEHVHGDTRVCRYPWQSGNRVSQWSLWGLQTRVSHWPASPKSLLSAFPTLLLQASTDMLSSFLISRRYSLTFIVIKYSIICHVLLIHQLIDICLFSLTYVFFVCVCVCSGPISRECLSTWGRVIGLFGSVLRSYFQSGWTSSLYIVRVFVLWDSLHNCSAIYLCSLLFLFWDRFHCWAQPGFHLSTALLLSLQGWTTVCTAVPSLRSYFNRSRCSKGGIVSALYWQSIVVRQEGLLAPVVWSSEGVNDWTVLHTCFPIWEAETRRLPGQVWAV